MTLYLDTNSLNFKLYQLKILNLQGVATHDMRKTTVSFFFFITIHSSVYFYVTTLNLIHAILFS